MLRDMAKSVRLADYLYEEVERLARAEKRSLANMVKVLLEQALQLESSGAAVGDVAVSGAALTPTAGEPERAAPDDHFKPDFGGKLK